MSKAIRGEKLSAAPGVAQMRPWFIRRSTAIMAIVDHGLPDFPPSLIQERMLLICDLQERWLEKRDVSIF